MASLRLGPACPSWQAKRSCVNVKNIEALDDFRLRASPNPEYKNVIDTIEKRQRWITTPYKRTTLCNHALVNDIVAFKQVGHVAPNRIRFLCTLLGERIEGSGMDDIMIPVRRDVVTKRSIKQILVVRYSPRVVFLGIPYLHVGEEKPILIMVVLASKEECNQQVSRNVKQTSGLVVMPRQRKPARMIWLAEQARKIRINWRVLLDIPNYIPLSNR